VAGSSIGQEFNGPMINHEPGLEGNEADYPLEANTDLYHYDLHVWVWQANPTGMFSQFNPTVKGK
jgi:hypothetical protein